MQAAKTQSRVDTADAYLSRKLDARVAQIEGRVLGDPKKTDEGDQILAKAEFVRDVLTEASTPPVPVPTDEGYAAKFKTERENKNRKAELAPDPKAAFARMDTRAMPASDLTERIVKEDLLKKAGYTDKPGVTRA